MARSEKPVKLTRRDVLRAEVGAVGDVVGQVRRARRLRKAWDEQGVGKSGKRKR